VRCDRHRRPLLAQSMRGGRRHGSPFFRSPPAHAAASGREQMFHMRSTPEKDAPDGIARRRMTSGLRDLCSDRFRPRVGFDGCTECTGTAVSPVASGAQQAGRPGVPIRHRPRRERDTSCGLALAAHRTKATFPFPATRFAGRVARTRGRSLALLCVKYPRPPAPAPSTRSIEWSRTRPRRG
jgi:hypothetical protein